MCSFRLVSEHHPAHSPTSDVQCTRRRVSFSSRFLLGVSIAWLCGAAAMAAVAKRPLPPVDLEFISSRMTLVARSEWTDERPKAWLLRSAGEFDRITIHHAGNSVNMNTEKNAVASDLEDIYTAHMERKYGDIAYHLVIDYAGRVWEGRSLAYEGAHVSGQNAKNIGVMVLGNFEKQEPSEKQLEAIRTLVDLLRDRYAIKRHRIYGHRDLGKSFCPGRNLYKHIVKLRN